MDGALIQEHVYVTERCLDHFEPLLHICIKLFLYSLKRTLRSKRAIPLDTDAARGRRWFLMWQSKIWNGQEEAFRMFAVFGIVFVLLLLPDRE
jgi:hypothetical protein